VKFDDYGDVDVLEVREVPRPSPGPGEVRVAVETAGINPGEASIRKGLVHDRWPATRGMQGGLTGLSVVPGEFALRVDSGQIAFAGRAANTGYHIGGARERVGAIRRVGGDAVGNAPGVRRPNRRPAEQGHRLPSRMIGRPPRAMTAPGASPLGGIHGIGRSGAGSGIRKS
jgi:hypothetical protein